MASQIGAQSISVNHGDVGYNGKVILYVIKGFKRPCYEQTVDTNQHSR